MKLGISSYSFTWAVGVPGYFPVKRLNELDLLDKAKKLGLNLLQIADNLPIHALGPERFSGLLEKSREMGIELEVGASSMSPENLEKYILIAEKAGCRILRFAPDSKNFRPSIDEIICTVKNVETELKKRGIILAIENHDRILSHEFVTIMEKIGSGNVGMCLDCANSLGAAEGLKEVVLNLAPFAVNFHLKEVSIRRKYHMMGFDIEGKPFGEGNLPLQWMLEQLPAQCKTAILEQWTPPENTIGETVVKEDDWATRSIRYLKPFFGE
jgi:3-oxoisoapionate decarboxylase